LTRWKDAAVELDHLEANFTNQQLSEDLSQRALTAILDDAPRPGAPATFTEEDKREIIALAAEEPEKAHVPITHWTHKLLAKAVIDRGIVKKISSSRVGVFLKESHIKTTSE
jgi:putative transposase